MKFTAFKTPSIPFPIWLLLGLAMGLSASLPALADGPKLARVPLLPLYKQECAACHLAYPPALLPAASWQRLMQTLPQHFGSDASLDPASVKALSEWLSANAAGSARGSRTQESPPSDRITKSAWFVREHHEIRAATWQRTAIKSAANCAACHTQAEQGDFNEHRIRIPQ